MQPNLVQLGHLHFFLPFVQPWNFMQRTRQLSSHPWALSHGVPSTPQWLQVTATGIALCIALWLWEGGKLAEPTATRSEN